MEFSEFQQLLQFPVCCLCACNSRCELLAQTATPFSLHHHRTDGSLRNCKAKYIHSFPSCLGHKFFIRPREKELSQNLNYENVINWPVDKTIKHLPGCCVRGLAHCGHSKTRNKWYWDIARSKLNKL